VYLSGTFTTAKRSDEGKTGKVVLTAELREENRQTGEFETKTVPWVTFEEGDTGIHHIDFIIDEQSQVKWTVTGDCGVVLNGEFAPTFLDEEEEEEEDGVEAE
jgi:hypothetical protein